MSTAIPSTTLTNHGSHISFTTDAQRTAAADAERHIDEELAAEFDSADTPTAAAYMAASALLAPPVRKRKRRRRGILA